MSRRSSHPPFAALALITQAACGTPATTAPSPAGNDASIVDAAPPVGLQLGPGVLLLSEAPRAGDTLVLDYQGSLSFSQTVYARVGFNGWNAVAGAPLTADGVGTGNVDYYQDLVMTKVGNGRWQTPIHLPTEARALHVAFYTDYAGSLAWDNQQGGDYNAGLPLVLHGPLLTWDAESKAPTGVVVSFHTGWPCKGRVAFGGDETTALAVEESSSGRAHHLHLNKLAPSSSYFYRLSCDALQDPSLRSFRTPSDSPTAFSFVVLSDIQETGESHRWKRAADLLLQHHDDAAFLLTVGDQPANDRPGFWWNFFDEGRDLFASHVIVPTIGNHDTGLGDATPGNTSFEKWFALDASSGSEIYRTVRFGNTTLFVLNALRYWDFELDKGEQTQWLAKELSAGPNTDWVFAAWHIPPYNAGVRHQSEQGLFRDITSLFGGRVDWVFCGHEHLYQRTRPMQYNGIIAPSGEYGRGSADGVGYVVTPAAAASPENGLIPSGASNAYYRSRLAYPIVPASTDLAPSENGYVIVSINKLTIRLTTWGIGVPGAPLEPHVLDEVTYTR